MPRMWNKKWRYFSRGGRVTSGFLPAAPASAGVFFVRALPAGVNLFGLNRRCSLTCCGICSGFGQPAAPGSGYVRVLASLVRASGSGFGLRTPGSGSNLFGFGAPNTRQRRKNPNIFQLASQQQKKAARISRINHVKKTNNCSFYTLL